MLRILAALALALLATACASTDKNYAALLATQEAIATSRAEAEKARYAAIAEIAKSSPDASARTAAVMALALGGSSANMLVNLPPPPEADGYKWAALVLGPITNIASGYFGYRLGVAQSDNQAASTIASYNTFGAMGGSIERAGVHGYQFVQAPQANQVLSGTGVLGSGSYSAPTTTTTTRNCTGGAAGNGAGTTTGGAGGAGGLASC